MSWRRESPHFARLLFDGIESHDDVAAHRRMFSSGGVSVSVDLFVVEHMRTDEAMAHTWEKLYRAWLDRFTDPARWKAAGVLVTNRGQEDL